MAMSIQWDTTLLTAYIRSGQHMLKKFHLHEDTKENYLQKPKRRIGRMYNVHLECFKQDSQLFMDLQDFSIVKHSKTS